MKLSECERILIVKPSSLGDIVHALPAVEAIHRAAPAAKIDWIANTEWVPLLEGIPFLENVIPFPRRDFRGISGLLRGKRWISEHLAKNGYDLAVDLQGLLRSALIAKFSGAREIVGFQNAREGAAIFYSEKVEVPHWWSLHAVDRNLLIAEGLGADISAPTFLLPEGDPLSDPVPENAVLLHPFSRGAGKSLSEIEVRELCEQLAPRPVVLAGIPDKSISEKWPKNVHDLLGKTTLPQLIHLLREAAWTISVDSGPMHLAAALGENVLSLHTWSNPKMVGPWRSGSYIARDSKIVRISELSADQFPERRDLKSDFAARDRLFSEQEITAMADFVNSRLP